MTPRSAVTPPAADALPLHAPYYADRAEFVSASIVLNEPIARDTYRLRLAAPGIARRITPGQFVMLRLAGLDDPMLGRAFALYDTPAGDDGQPTLEVVYAVHGKFTTALAPRRPGDAVEIWGPLGNGFGVADAAPDAPNVDAQFEHLLLVAGGIGQTPFLALGKEALGSQAYGDESDRPRIRAARVTLCYGVRSADRLAGADDFRSAGLDLRVASDDGSVGHHGLVTELLQQTLDEPRGGSVLVACCGPEPMMAAVAEVCRDAGVRCLASLETPMACGVGVCFSCVARVRQPEGDWDYKRTCVEGPIFDAEKIVW